MTNVIKVAKSDKDVDSNNPNDFIFHSLYNTFKIIKSDIYEWDSPSAAGEYTTTIAHGLANPACFLLFFNFGDTVSMVLSNISSIAWGETASATPATYVYNAYIDSTNIGFTYRHPLNTNITVGVRYYIFETPLI